MHRWQEEEAEWQRDKARWAATMTKVERELDQVKSDLKALEVAKSGGLGGGEIISQAPPGVLSLS